MLALHISERAKFNLRACVNVLGDSGRKSVVNQLHSVRDVVFHHEPFDMVIHGRNGDTHFVGYLLGRNSLGVKLCDGAGAAAHVVGLSVVRRSNNLLVFPHVLHFAQYWPRMDFHSTNPLHFDGHTQNRNPPE